jgi:hypothetical protein
MQWGNIHLAQRSRAKNRVLLADQAGETSEDVNVTDLCYEFAIMSMGKILPANL